MGKKYKKNKNGHQHKNDKTNEITSEFPGTPLATFEQRTELAAYINLVKKYGAAQNRVPIVFLDISLIHFFSIQLLRAYVDKDNISNSLTFRFALLMLPVFNAFMLAGVIIYRYFSNLLNGYYPVGYIGNFDINAINVIPDNLSLGDYNRLIVLMKSRLSTLEGWFQKYLSIGNILVLSFLSLILTAMTPIKNYTIYFTTIPVVMFLNLKMINAMIATTDQSCIDRFKQRLDLIIFEFKLTWQLASYLNKLTVLTLPIKASPVKETTIKVFLSDLKIALTQQGVDVLQCNGHAISVIFNAEFSDEKALKAQEFLSKRIQRRQENEKQFRTQMTTLESLISTVYASRWEKSEITKDEHLLPAIYFRLAKEFLNSELQKIFKEGLISIYGKRFQATERYFEVPLIENFDETSFTKLKEEINNFCDREMKKMSPSLSENSKIVIKSFVMPPTSTLSFFPLPKKDSSREEGYTKKRSSGKEEETELPNSNTQDDQENGAPTFQINTPGFKYPVFLQFLVTQEMFKNIREKTDVDAYQIYLDMLTRGAFFVPSKGKNGLVKLDKRSGHATLFQYKLKHANCDARVGVKEAGDVKLSDGSTVRMLKADTVLEHRYKH